MSKHRLKVTLTDQPEPDAAVSARKVSIRSRIARPDDDLMALARAVGVTQSGGDAA